MCVFVCVCAGCPVPYDAYFRLFDEIKTGLWWVSQKNSMLLNRQQIVDISYVDKIY